MKIHGKRPVQKVCPFTKGNNDERPLGKYCQVKQIQPQIALDKPQVDEQTYSKGGKTHQEKPDYKEPIGWLRVFAQFFLFTDTCIYKQKGNGKYSYTLCIS